MEKMLRKLPFFCKDILFTLWGIKAKKERYGIFYKKYLDLFMRSMNWSLDRVITFQDIQLRKLLKEAYKGSSYYKDVFRNLGITYGDLDHSPTQNILRELPFLEKAFVKNNASYIENKLRKTYVYSYTSGTTGTPLKIPFDKESWQMGFAVLRRFYNLMGLPKNFTSVRLTGRNFVNQNTKKKFWIRNFITNQIFMSTYHLREENLPYYVNALNKYRPALIEGYPSAIYVIAKFILDKGYELSFRPIAIATTAETLYDEQRAIIEQAFNAKVYNQYASSEGAPVVTECGYGKLHLNLDTGIFEFFNMKGEPAKPGELAEVIVTSFLNWKLPLVRYKIKDIFLLASNSRLCECGLSWPYVEKIIGREDDIVYVKGKGYIGIVNERIFKHLPGLRVKMVQIVQKSIDRFVFRVVRDRGYNEEDEYRILKEAKNVLGEEVTIEFEYLEKIPLSSRGKFKSVIREFKI